jgi:hypothetical protein
MANYYGVTRSNYFAVKNEEEFRAEIANLPVELIEAKEEGKKVFGFIDSDADGGGDIDTIWNEETDESEEVDWQAFFQKHLADDWVAIIVASGAEKYRYINGYAIAYNNKGETRSVGIEDIYKLAEDLGSFRKHASY